MVSAGLIYVPGGSVPPGFCFQVVTCRKRESRCYVPASVVFWGQKAGCWDSPKPLKVSGIVLTSAVVSQRRCLLVYCVKSTWLILLDTLTPVRYQFGRRRAARTDYSFVFIHSSSISNPRELQRSTKSS